MRQVVKTASVGIGTRTCLLSQFKLISNNTYNYDYIFYIYKFSGFIETLSSSGFLLR